MSLVNTGKFLIVTIFCKHICFYIHVHCSTLTIELIVCLLYMYCILNKTLELFVLFQLLMDIKY